MLIENAAILISLGALILASYSVYKAIKMPQYIEEKADSILNTLDLELKEVLDPINEKISKSYSHLGSKGAHVRQVQALDKKLAQDVLNMQDPMIKGALDLFPNVRDYVEKNPDLLMELLPRIQQLQGIEGFNPLDLISPPSSKNTSLPSNSRERVWREE